MMFSHRTVKRTVKKMTNYERTIDAVDIWTGYYRANPHRFVHDFLHVDLKIFQQILVFMMNISIVFVFIATRGIGKTYLSAIFCVVRCVLYPGTKICIVSGTRGQA